MKRNTELWEKNMFSFILCLVQTDHKKKSFVAIQYSKTKESSDRKQCALYAAWL